MKTTFVLTIVALVLLTASAYAASPAVSWTTLSHQEAWNGVTLGYDFQVGSSAVAVTEFGYFDFGNDGLQFDHQVGIWNQAGTLLAQATVSAGIVNNLEDKYRYVGLTAPLILSANTKYTIGGTANGEQYGLSNLATGFTFNSLLASVGPSKYTYASGLNKPVTGPYWTAGPIYAGPNFKLAAVPEASTMVGFGSALVMAAPGLVGWIRKRK